MSDHTAEVTVQSLAQLHRQLGDMLDVAIAAGAPMRLLEKLGAARGLLQALGEVPKHALVPGVVSRAQRAMQEWRDWQRNDQRKFVA